MFDPDIARSLIPIVAIGGGITALIFKRWTSHIQEMARIRSTSNNNLSQEQNSAIELLRREIVQLRDTTTQYDVSVEKTLNDLRNRVAHIESRIETPSTSPSEPSASFRQPSEFSSAQPIEQTVRVGQSTESN